MILLLKILLFLGIVLFGVLMVFLASFKVEIWNTIYNNLR
jgi:hypothetical protein